MRRVATVLVLASSLTVSCAVPTQDAPHVLTNATLPPEQVTPRSTAPARADATVFFVRDDRPAAVTRRVAGAGVEDALSALLAGPTDAEISSGFRTTLPADTQIQVVDTAEGVAVFDVGSVLDGVTGEEQILVFAQLVLTAAAASDVDRVAFERAGRRIDAPALDGTLVARPLTAGDYEPLLTER